MGALVERAVHFWDECQPSSGWPIDPKANRFTLAFQLLDDSSTPPPVVSPQSLKQAIDESAMEANSKINRGLVCFLWSGVENHTPVSVNQNNIFGYEARMVTSNGKYDIFPTSWQIWADGSGVETHAHHEDTSWFTANASKRNRFDIQTGKKFSPEIKLAEIQQFLIFVRSFSQFFTSVTHAELEFDCVGLYGRETYNTYQTHTSISSHCLIDDHVNNKLCVPILSLTGDRINHIADELLLSMLQSWRSGGQRGSACKRS